MEYNIIEKYMKFLKKEFTNFFKIVLRDDYSKQTVDSFIDKYILVRYYDETDYPEEKDLISRINNEFIELYKGLLNEENDNLLRNIVALFGYLMCFDDTDVFTEEVELINTLMAEESIKVKRDESMKKELIQWVKNLKKQKDSFNSSVVSKDFNLIEKRICTSTFKLELEHHVKVSNLYSEYAINKVYTSGKVNEDKAFVTYVLASFEALENARNVDFAKHYVVSFPSTLFEKGKKIQRLFNILDNILAKKTISIMINYEDYLKNKLLINNYIKEGYSFGVTLDSTFDYDLNGLIIFDYVFINSNSEFYDMIISDKDKIKTRLIVL